MEIVHNAFTLRNRLPFPDSNSAIALRVVTLGTRISKGSLRSSATRSISRRIASEIDNPIKDSNASAARSFVLVSMRARTYVSAVAMDNDESVAT